MEYPKSYLFIHSFAHIQPSSCFLHTHRLASETESSAAEVEEQKAKDNARIGKMELDGTCSGRAYAYVEH